jgi:hypothetical protein
MGDELSSWQWSLQLDLLLYGWKGVALRRSCRSSGVAEWGIELLPGSRVFSSIFCSMVGKELRKSGVAGVQELQNGGLSFFLAVESSARSFALWLERS